MHFTYRGSTLSVHQGFNFLITLKQVANFEKQNTCGILIDITVKKLQFSSPSEVTADACALVQNKAQEGPTSAGVPDFLDLQPRNNDKCLPYQITSPSTAALTGSSLDGNFHSSGN